MKRSLLGRWAAAYAGHLDWPVIPVEPGGKKPLLRLVPNGSSHGTTDPNVIDYWWQKEPQANIGIVCRNLLVIDVDARRGGLDTLANWNANHGKMPLTATEETGRGDGSLHLFFARPDFETRGKLRGGVDIITGNLAVTVTPSVHPLGGSYRWLIPPDPVAELPTWLAQLVRAPVVPPELPPLPRAPEDRRLERARAYAAKMDPAQSGAHGHAATMRAAVLMVRGFNLSVEEAFVILSEWNLRCLPPWSERELKRKIREADRRGRMPRGALLVEKKGIP